MVAVWKKRGDWLWRSNLQIRDIADTARAQKSMARSKSNNLSSKED
jgi:hypothetical protein